MKCQKIVLIKGDNTEIEGELYDHQPEGLYRYIPDENDEITLILYKDETEIARAETKHYSESFVFILDTTNIDPGMYKYSVILNKSEDDKPHHVVLNQEIEII